MPPVGSLVKKIAPVAGTIFGGPVGAIGGTLLGGLLGGSSGSDRAASTAQSQALTAQTGLADLMRRLTQQQMDLTGPAYQQGLRHYQSLLGGNRTAMANAVLPERRAISDTYRGAESFIGRNLTGASRDRQLGELARERSGRLSDLIPGVRQQAADTLLREADPARLLSGLGQASGAYGAASGTAGDILNQSRASRASDMAQGAEWAKLFKLLFNPGQPGTKNTVPDFRSLYPLMQTWGIR